MGLALKPTVAEMLSEGQAAQCVSVVEAYKHYIAIHPEFFPVLGRSSYWEDFHNELDKQGLLLPKRSGLIDCTIKEAMDSKQEQEAPSLAVSGLKPTAGDMLEVGIALGLSTVREAYSYYTSHYDMFFLISDYAAQDISFHEDLANMKLVTRKPNNCDDSHVVEMTLEAAYKSTGKDYDLLVSQMDAYRDQQ